MQSMIGSVDRLEIINLINDSPRYDSCFKGCFGISFWLKLSYGDSHKNILFDVGPLAEPLFYNAGKLGLRLSDLDMIVLSHCHFDHTAALADIVTEIGHEVPIFGHPDIFRTSLTLRPEFKNYGMVGRNRRESIEQLGGYFILTRSPVEPVPGCLLTGEVERTTEFEDVGGASCFTVDAHGNLVSDKMKDDISVVVNVRNKGIVIVTGCAHAGPVNIVKHAIRVSGVNSLEGIAGGFHLLEAGQDRVDRTIEELKKNNPRWIAPLHCTGIVPSAKIAAAFPEGYRGINAGDIIICSAAAMAQ